MEKNIAIEFNNVGKQYRLGRIGTGTLQHDISRWWQTSILGKPDPYLMIGDVNDRSAKEKSDYVWALKNIDFKIEQGDVVGIIGKNGAGKSTLLKLLSHITAPTTGNINYRGRIASLLEVGTGFHPDMTARENIYMNGSILGMTRQEITDKLDDIVDFAGVNKYIDTPVKRFSSGMTVRLGFAVAAFLEPEILVVDEVLAVGDAEFQRRAIGKMKDISAGNGRTVLFVSHNMAAVRNLCKNGIILNNGLMEFSGTIGDAIDRYLLSSTRTSSDDIKEHISYCAPHLTIESIRFNGSTSSSSTLKDGQSTVCVEIYGHLLVQSVLDLKVAFKNSSGVPLATLAEGHYKGIIQSYDAGAFHLRREIILPKYLCAGDLIIDISLHHPNVCMLMHAPECVNVQCDGSLEKFGQVINIGDSGIMGLETVENTK